MVNVWTFDSIRMWDVLIYDSDIESNFQTLAICLFFYPSVSCTILDNSQSFRTFLSLKIKLDIYNFLRGNVSQSNPIWFNVRIIWDIPNSNCNDSKSNVQTFAICLFVIAQWALKSRKIARPLELSYLLQ